MRNNYSMNIVLTQEQEEAAERLVKAGLFASKDEAIARSLDWLREEAEKLASIRATIERSIGEADRGLTRPANADEIMRRVRQRLAEEKAARPPA